MLGSLCFIDLFIINKLYSLQVKGSTSIKITYFAILLPAFIYWLLRLREHLIPEIALTLQPLCACEVSRLLDWQLNSAFKNKSANVVLPLNYLRAQMRPDEEEWYRPWEDANMQQGLACNSNCIARDRASKRKGKATTWQLHSVVSLLEISEIGIANKH